MLKARVITFTFIDVQKNQLLKLTFNRSPRMHTFSFFPADLILISPFSAAYTHSGLLRCLDHNPDHDVCYSEGKQKQTTKKKNTLCVYVKQKYSIYRLS